MPTTPHWKIDHIEQSQSQKEVTANLAFDRLEGGVAQQLSKAAAGGSPTPDITLTDAEALYSVYLKITGAMVTAIDLIVPDNNHRYIIENATTGGFAITCKTSAGSGITVNAGDVQEVYCDATNVVQVTAPAAATGAPYDVSVQVIPGAPADGGTILRHPFSRTVLFPASLTNSQAVAGTAATAESIFSVKKGGVEFGTITFAISGTVGTFVAASPTTFVATDVLTITAPSPQDATLADIGITLAGNIA